MLNYKFYAVSYNECKAEYISFRNENRGNFRDETYFEWRFLKKPGGCVPLIAWVESASGEKIGSVGFTQDVYAVNGEPYPFGQLCDISISKKWRGKGIAKVMLEFLSGLEQFKEKKLCFAMPNQDAARALEKSGWSTLVKIDRYVKILKVDSKIQKIFGQGMLSRVVACSVNFALEFSSYEKYHRKEKQYSAGPVDGFDERFDTFWSEYGKNGGVYGLRTSKYLTWRYVSHPYINYKIFALFEGERIRGYAVYFFDDGKCNVEDIFSAQGDDYPRLLLLYFIRFIREHSELGSIVVRMNRSEVNKLPLKQFGFFRRADSQIFMTYTNDKSIKTLTAPGKWFLTSGDKDV